MLNPRPVLGQGQCICKVHALMKHSRYVFDWNYEHIRIWKFKTDVQIGSVWIMFGYLNKSKIHLVKGRPLFVPFVFVER